MVRETKWEILLLPKSLVLHALLIQITADSITAVSFLPATVTNIIFLRKFDLIAVFFSFALADMIFFFFFLL